MFQAAVTTPVRAYQVRIRDEYLEKLYEYDAGTVEQEIFARAEGGMIVVMTDRPETIFQKLGEAIESVTYLGPTVGLPEHPVYANHSAVSRTQLIRESEDEDLVEGLWPDDRPIHIRALAFAARAGHLVMLPFLHILGSAFKKILPDRALRALHIGEES
jgi:hypothetical protein